MIAKDSMTHDVLAGIYVLVIGLCLIVFRKRCASVAVRWNARLLGMRLNSRFMEFTYLVGGLMGIALGVMLIVDGLLH